MSESASKAGSKPIRTVRPPKVRKQQQKRAWHSYITIDVVKAAADRTVLHPFVAWMVPLCLRAVTVPYEDLSMRFSIGYAGFLTLLWILSVFNNRIAYGLPREVDYEEEVVLITGGASGLGKLIADFYAMRGTSVAVLDVKKPEEGETNGAKYYHCDIGDRKQVQDAVSLIKHDLGVPTILINNAGVMHAKSILDHSAEELEQTLRVNLLSHWHTVQTCLPDMLKEERGTIVTIASVLGYLGPLNLSAYAASKAGLLAFHSTLQAELSASLDPAAREIKTVLVAPGQLDTPMFRGMTTPSNFLAPVVAPVELARAIVEQIDSGWSGEVSLPLYARFVPIIPGLPTSLQRAVKGLSGMNRAMVDFTRKKKDA